MHSLEKHLGLPSRYGLDVVHVTQQVTHLTVVHEHVYGRWTDVYAVCAYHVWMTDRAKHLQLSGQELAHERSTGLAFFVDHLIAVAFCTRCVFL